MTIDELQALVDNGSKYLTINESRRVGDKNEYSRILVFEDHMPAFTEGFKKVYNFLAEAENRA